LRNQSFALENAAEGTSASNHKINAGLDNIIAARINEQVAAAAISVARLPGLGADGR